MSLSVCCRLRHGADALAQRESARCSRQDDWRERETGSQGARDDPGGTRTCCGSRCSRNQSNRGRQREPRVKNIVRTQRRTRRGARRPLRRFLTSEGLPGSGQEAGFPAFIGSNPILRCACLICRTRKVGVSLRQRAAWHLHHPNPRSSFSPGINRSEAQRRGLKTPPPDGLGKLAAIVRSVDIFQGS